MLGEGVVVCLQWCEERRWLFVFSDVRRGGDCLSSVMWGEGVVVGLQWFEERRCCLSSVRLCERVIVRLQWCSVRGWVFVFSDVRRGGHITEDQQLPPHLTSLKTNHHLLSSHHWRQTTTSSPHITEDKQPPPHLTSLKTNNHSLTVFSDVRVRGGCLSSMIWGETVAVCFCCYLWNFLIVTDLVLFSFY
jgi:hypothetical protein